MRLHTRLLGGALAVSLFTQLAACGTLLYPERRGQIGGKIDPAVAIMDAIGILFFVIPGLLAFAIDFTTGAIYMPGGKHAQIDPQLLQQAVGPDGRVDPLRLQQIIEAQTGQRLPLDHPQLLQQHGTPQQLASFGLQPAA